MSEMWPLARIDLLEIWNYYLSLEDDLKNTSRYVEPSGQENVYSFEFAKLLILACTEIESVFKIICNIIKGEPVKGDISTYKEVILGKYPKIVETVILPTRLGYKIRPFSHWKDGKLPWWSAYQAVKHNRGDCFNEATYINATTAIGALYILMIYLGKITGIPFNDAQSNYFFSDYCHQMFCAAPPKQLPDFEDTAP